MDDQGDRVHSNHPCDNGDQDPAQQCAVAAAEGNVVTENLQETIDLSPQPGPLITVEVAQVMTTTHNSATFQGSASSVGANYMVGEAAPTLLIDLRNLQTIDFLDYGLVEPQELRYIVAGPSKPPSSSSDGVTSEHSNNPDSFAESSANSTASEVHPSHQAVLGGGEERSSTVEPTDEVYHSAVPHYRPHCCHMKHHSDPKVHNCSIEVLRSDLHSQHSESYMYHRDSKSQYCEHKLHQNNPPYKTHVDSKTTHSECKTNPTDPKYRDTECDISHSTPRSEHNWDQNTCQYGDIKAHFSGPQSKNSKQPCHGNTKSHHCKHHIHHGMLTSGYREHNIQHHDPQSKDREYHTCSSDSKSLHNEYQTFQTEHQVKHKKSKVQNSGPKSQQGKSKTNNRNIQSQGRKYQTEHIDFDFQHSVCQAYQSGFKSQYSEQQTHYCHSQPQCREYKTFHTKPHSIYGDEITDESNFQPDHSNYRTHYAESHQLYSRTNYNDQQGNCNAVNGDSSDLQIHRSSQVPYQQHGVQYRCPEFLLRESQSAFKDNKPNYSESQQSYDNHEPHYRKQPENYEVSDSWKNCEDHSPHSELKSHNLVKAPDYSELKSLNLAQTHDYSDLKPLNLVKAPGSSELKSLTLAKAHDSIELRSLNLAKVPDFSEQKSLNLAKVPAFSELKSLNLAKAHDFSELQPRYRRYNTRSSKSKPACTEHDHKYSKSQPTYEESRFSKSHRILKDRKSCQSESVSNLQYPNPRRNDSHVDNKDSKLYQSSSDLDHSEHYTDAQHHSSTSNFRSFDSETSRTNPEFSYTTSKSRKICSNSNYRDSRSPYSETKSHHFSRKSLQGESRSPYKDPQHSYMDSMSRELSSSYDQRKPVCKECGEKTDSKSLLEKHKMCHNSGHPFSCFMCSCAYKKRNHLFEHISNAHILQ